jgi:hypothetical protein
MDLTITKSNVQDVDVAVNSTSVTVQQSNSLLVEVTPQQRIEINLDRTVTGNGIPSGGTTGQALIKASNTNYDAIWASIGSGTVTNVTGTAPISVATGTTTPVVSMAQASGSVNGWLSNVDWATFNGKQTAYTNLTSIGSLVNGNGWLRNNGTGTFSYSTPTAADVGAVPTSRTISTTSPLAGGGALSSNLTLSMPAATSTQNGYLTSTDWATFNSKGNGTVSSVGITAGTGITVLGSPITSSGSITVTNSAPDQIVSLTAGANVTITGSYPSFTIAATGGGGGGSGTVTSVGLALPSEFTITNSPVNTSGTLTGAWANQSANYIFAAPNGSSGTPTFRSLVSADIPALNYVSSVSGSGVISSSGGLSPTISISQAGSSADGYLSSTDWNTFNSKGTVTSVAASAGAGISISGSPITSSGTLTITNTAPDQTVVLNSGTGISASGTYPNFTITNSLPDQVVSLTGAGTTTVTGTYPNFTISSTGGSGGGDVTGATSSTDNAITRFNGTTGKVIQNSTVTLDDNGNIINANSIGFDTTPATVPTADGVMSWDDGDGVPSVQLKGGNTTLQIGTQEYARVYNDSGTTLTKGQVVYISGAQGNRVAVKLAKADVEATSFGTIGLVAESIANGAEGFIIVSGALYKLNTTGLTAGAAVYLSPTTAGAYTTTEPQAPNQLVVLGWVERVHATVGSIYVKIDNGYELTELHDVQITSPTSGNTLIYDASVGVWKNSNLTDGTGINITEGAGSITITNTAPDQTVSLTAGSGINVTGTYPAFTIAATASSANIQEFTTAGTSTWTKPAGAKFVYVLCQGGGGGGGSGHKQLASPTQPNQGGQGGAGGGWIDAIIPAALLGSTETVTVATGGTGGASKTTSGIGNDGTAGGNSSFGSWCIGRGGNGGTGGSTTTQGSGSIAPNTANNILIAQQSAGASTTVFAGYGGGRNAGLAGGNAGNGGKNAGGGGGGGGLANPAVAALAGGNGGSGGAGVIASTNTLAGSGGAGGTAGGNGTAGADATNDYLGAAGGGGGSSSTSANGGSGANGGYPAGGGGGGGSCLSSFNSGAGGNGGDGYVLVITVF